MQEKVVVVTGAARGIGAAVARHCALEGAHVVLWDRSRADVEAAAEALERETGAQCLAEAVDVASPEAVETAAGAVLARFGRIDGLVNNAGIVDDARLKNMSQAQWDRVISVNLTGVYNCTRAFVDAFLAQGSGSIVVVSSVVGVYGNFGQTNYAAAKAGVIGMAKSWAKELGRRGVRANAICPGFIETPILDGMQEKVLDALVGQVPLQRMGRPEEIAHAAGFLVSDEASYVNGAVLEVSGGLTL